MDMYNMTKLPAELKTALLSSSKTENLKKWLGLSKCFWVKPVWSIKYLMPWEINNYGGMAAILTLTIPCPGCKKTIKCKNNFCPHCGAELSLPDNFDWTKIGPFALSENDVKEIVEAQIVAMETDKRKCS